MPSSTKKQARTMAAAAHNPAFAEKVGIPQKVARDFNQADKGGKLLSSAMKEERGEPPAPAADEFNEPRQRARSHALRTYA